MTFYFTIYNKVVYIFLVCGGRLLPTNPSRHSPVIRGQSAPPFPYFSKSLSILVRLWALLFNSAASWLLKSPKHNSEGTVIVANATVVGEEEHPSTRAIAVIAPAPHPRVRRVDKRTSIPVPSILSCRFRF